MATHQGKRPSQSKKSVIRGRTVMTRRALRLTQTKETAIYLFALSGEDLLAAADISRISRDEAGKLIGYQRPEVKRHVKDIVDYLDGAHVIFLFDYWSAVAEIFDVAWELPPKKSRLTHGCGILSMGYLMEEIAHSVGLTARDRPAAFRREITKVERVCAWTAGEWKFAEDIHRRWNDIQNTPNDTALVTNYLLASYRKARG